MFFRNAVNVPSVSHEEYAEMQPYIELAERLGSFLSQVREGTPGRNFSALQRTHWEWKTGLSRRRRDQREF